MELVSNIEKTGMLFWSVSIIGFILIWIVGYFAIGMFKRPFKSDRTKAFVEKLGQWVLLFISMVYVFSFLGESNWMRTEIFNLSGTVITPVLIVVILFAIVIAFKLSSTIRRYLLPTLYARYNIDTGPQATINTLLHYAIVLVMIAFTLSSLGFSFSSLTIFASVLGVGIGFGLQNIMNNFISGLIILFDRPIEVGDRVVIDDTFTDIEKIKIRHTIVRTRLNERIIIPNSYFLENKFVNRSYTDRRLRVTIDVGVDYGDELDIAERELLLSISDLQSTEYGGILTNPCPEVYVENFDEYSVHMRLFFWIDDQSSQAEFLLPSEARKIIYKRFFAAGVNFAFPRQNVYLVNEAFVGQEASDGNSNSNETTI